MRGQKVVLLNDLISDINDDVLGDIDLDWNINGHFYDQETDETGVIYQIYNVFTSKSYIGKVFSYEKHGKQPATYYGAKGRFKRHWSNSRGDNADNDCPVFYKALKDSDIHDWFVFTLMVVSKKHLKETETRKIKEYNTSDPNFGYNFFVGDNKPDNAEHLLKYSTAKAATNVNRAANGQMKREGHSKNLPANINYRPAKQVGNNIVSEGYFVQIKIDGHVYNKAFSSKMQTMEDKLSAAIKQLELFKKQAADKRAAGSKSTGKLASKKVSKKSYGSKSNGKKKE